MNLARAWRITARELRMGPRSPLIMWAIVLPVVITFVVQGVFGSLFAAKPRLGIVDFGDSAVTRAALELEGIEVELVDDEATLLRMVEEDDLDAGLVLPSGFDGAVRAGEQPELRFFVGGESLASNRVILAVTTIDLVREVAGERPPVEVEVVALGDEGFDIATRLIPLTIMYAVAVGGAFIPAASLVEERERKTLDALLVTPTTMNEILVGKGLLGFVLAMATGVMTLILNGVFGTQTGAVLLALVLAAWMMVEVGLLLGSWAKDTNTMFTAFKGGGIFLFYPVIVFIWPDLPEWIARLGPTFYFLKPMFDLAVGGAGLGDVWVDMVIGVAICLVLIPAVVAMGRRLERQAAMV